MNKNLSSHFKGFLFFLLTTLYVNVWGQEKKILSSEQINKEGPFASVALAQQTQKNTLAGNYGFYVMGSSNWYFPPLTTSAIVSAWGAGGAGGGAKQNGNNQGGGGGGGAFSQSTIAINDAIYYPYVAGPGGVAVTGEDGGNGGDSYFNNPTTLFAKGGAGGTFGNNSYYGGGGSGGAASAGIGTLKNSGGNGTSQSSAGIYGPGGGSAGSGSNGGTGVNTSPAGGAAGTGTYAGAKGGDGVNGNNPGNAGIFPGGGGSGGSKTYFLLFPNDNQPGGAGADGRIMMQYSGYCRPINNTSATTISGVQTTGGTTNINKISNGFGSFGYSNFYNTDKISITAGNSFTMSITTTGGTSGIAVYVDYNKDKSFTLAERVYNSANFQPTGTTTTSSITVPLNQLAGDYVIRVVTDYYSQNPDACSFSTTYLGNTVAGTGEMEDYKLTVVAPVPTLTAVSPTAVCAGSSVTITGTNFVNVSGVTIGGNAVSYTVNSPTQITVTGITSGGTVSVTTAGGTTTSTSSITVNPVSAAGTASAAAATLCSGNSTDVNLNGYTGSIQWESSTDGTNFSTLSGQTAASFNTGNLSVTTWYRAVVKSGVCTSVTSNAIKITVNTQATYANLNAPGTVDICQGGLITATGQVYIAGNTEAAGQGSETAEFGYSSANTDPSGTGWTWVPASFNTQNNNNDEFKYTFTPSSTGTYYYTFRYKNGVCGYVYGGYSASGGGIWDGTNNVNGTLNVAQPAAVGTASIDKNYFCQGSTVALNLSSSSGNVQWQFSHDGGATFQNIPGATTASYTDSPSQNTVYRAVVSSGACTAAVSGTVSTQIEYPVTWGNLQWPGTESICLGSQVQIFGRVYAQGATPNTTARLQVEFGYSTTSADPHDASWTWTSAGVSQNTAFVNQSGENNAEYSYTFAPSSNGTYYYTFRYKNGACADYVYGGFQNDANFNHGGVWNGTNNITGILEVGKATIYESGNWTVNPASNPHLSAEIRENFTTTADYSFCSLHVSNNAKFTINVPNKVTVQNSVNIDAGSNLEIASDANLLQVNDAAVNSGNATVQRNINFSSTRNQYNYLSSPVTFASGQNFKTIYPGVTSANYPTVLYYNEANDRFYASSGANILGRGLAVKEVSATSGITANRAEFKGVPYNGAFNYNLARTDATHGYNLIGNPYPSNINLEELYDQSVNISPTFYFWDNTNNTQTSQQGSGYTQEQYAKYNVAAGTASGTGNPAPALGSAGKVPNAITKVGQGFITQAINSGASIHWDNSVRTGDNTGASFFSKNEVQDDRFWITMKTPENLVISSAVVYFANGNNSFGVEDSKVWTVSSDDFYTLAETTPVNIHGRSLFADTDVVPVGVRAFTNGLYTIAVSKKEGVFTNAQKIYLKDKDLNIVTDLSEGSYTFLAEAGLDEGRFEIVYKPALVLATDNSALNDLIVYRHGENFEVKSSQSIQEVEMYDASGKLYHTIKGNAKLVTVPAAAVPSGMYLLKIKQATGNSVRKVVK